VEKIAGGSLELEKANAGEDHWCWMYRGRGRETPPTPRRGDTTRVTPRLVHEFSGESAPGGGLAARDELIKEGDKYRHVEGIC